VLRGGSWNNNQDNARATYRNDNDPDDRNNNIGFRVVCVSHIGWCFDARHGCPWEQAQLRVHRQCLAITVAGPRRSARDGAG
jgi:hypothetical protein